jgi:hypothetical protein
VSLPVYPNKIFGIKASIVKTPEFSTVVQASAGGDVTTIPQMVNPLWHFNLAYEQLFNDATQNVFKNASYTATELQTLLGFNLSQGGQNGVFLFDDPEDDTVTNQALQLVNDGAAPPNWYSPLQRTMGDPTVAQFSEDVTDLNPQNFSGLTVKANGGAASSTTDYSVGGPGLSLPGYSFLALYVKWKAWQANFAYTVGTLLIDSAGHLQKVTAATGNSGATIPTFNAGGTTTDGSVTWTDQGLATVTASFQFYFRVRFEEDKIDFERFLFSLYTIGGSEAQRGNGMVKLVTRRPVMGP